MFFFAEIGKGRLTVGKIYGGLLILENWKATKFGKVAMSEAQVGRKAVAGLLSQLPVQKTSGTTTNPTFFKKKLSDFPPPHSARKVKPVTRRSALGSVPVARIT